jgi:hypothetical protein
MGDVLTEDEESALAIVRETLLEVRAGGRLADIRGICAAVAAAGARVTAENGESASFAHRSARFTVRFLAENPGRFVLSFNGADQ